MSRVAGAEPKWPMTPTHARRGVSRDPRWPAGSALEAHAVLRHAEDDPPDWDGNLMAADGLNGRSLRRRGGY